MSRDDNPYSTPETQATVTAELPLSAIQQRTGSLKNWILAQGR